MANANLSNTENAVVLLAGSVVHMLRTGELERAQEYITALSHICRGYCVESEEPVKQLANALHEATWTILSYRQY